jgi:hypothetical protein
MFTSSICDMPDGFDTFNDLHVVNNQRIEKDDWSMIHLKYVNLW